MWAVVEISFIPYVRAEAGGEILLKHNFGGFGTALLFGVDETCVVFEGLERDASDRCSGTEG